jgi:hypothetical protein
MRVHLPSMLAISSLLVAPGLAGTKRTSTPSEVIDEYAHQLDSPNTIPSAKDDIVSLRIAVPPQVSRAYLFFVRSRALCKSEARRRQ